MSEAEQSRLELLEGGALPRGGVEAVVTAVLGPATVRLEAEGASFDATALVLGSWRPATGDRVLALREERGAWVLGVIGSIRAVAPVPQSRTRDGVHAVVAPDGDTLTVRGASGEVLFEHDARTGQSRVVARDLEVSAGATLSLEAHEKVAVRAPEIELTAGDESLRMSEPGTELRSSRLHAVLKEARVSALEGVLAVERLDSAVKQARSFVDVLELRAGRIVERAKETYREVDDVAQTRAGRIRTVAKTAFQVLAQRATVQAEEDLELMGDKIHLG
ncbi:MAG: DUF3540 domain-containing protein [Sandaracinaceae bacterium]|nr:DUF3540 domain-containing protein [Sandaracinaceae bacterium]